MVDFLDGPAGQPQSIMAQASLLHSKVSHLAGLDLMNQHLATLTDRYPASHLVTISSHLAIISPPLPTTNTKLYSLKIILHMPNDSFEVMHANCYYCLS